MSLFNNLPLTRIKIAVAKLLYRFTKIFVKGDVHIIKRGNITYQVDLTEGLDLSLYLFGNFQSHVSQNKYLHLREGAVIFDVGANVGVMTLQFARGGVYAFEPTHYAYQKLVKNIALNPQLANKIKTVQAFVTSPDKIDKKIIAYSSWKIGGKSEKKEHPVHKGTAMPAEGVGSLTLDLFCKKENIKRVDFIKIDTDGHEPDVLNGAKETLAKYKPKVIFEIGLYVMKEKGICFDFYTGLFGELNYQLFNSSNLKEINSTNYRKIIPEKGTIDILAIPA